MTQAHNKSSLGPCDKNFSTLSRDDVCRVCFITQRNLIDLSFTFDFMNWMHVRCFGFCLVYDNHM